MPSVVPVFLVRRKERARPSRTATPATRATFSKASTEAESIYSGFLGSSEHLPSVLKSLLRSEGAGQAIADSNASDTRHFLKGVNRSRIHLFRLSRFIGAPAIGIEVVTQI